MRLAMVVVAAAVWAWATDPISGWVFGGLLAVNLGLDLVGTRLARSSVVPSPAGAAIHLLAAKGVYALLFSILALENLMPPWLALALLGRDIALLSGALWLGWRAGEVPLASVHERWPTQLLLGALALSVIGMPSLRPGVLLLFGLVLTRLPGFWFRFCELADPLAYHPELLGEQAVPPAATWQQALRSALAHPSSRLTLTVVPVGLLAVALAAVWLTGSTASPRPPVVSSTLVPMAALLDQTTACPAWAGAINSQVLTFFLFLPALLVLPGVIALHLREITLLRPLARSSALWPGLFAGGVAGIITLASLAVYVLASKMLIGPQLDCLLWAYGGLGMFAANVLILSAVVLPYTRRFPHEPPLVRLQIAGGSLSTPFIVLLLGQLLGLFSPRYAGPALAGMLLFVAFYTAVAGYPRRRPEPTSQ